MQRNMMFIRRTLYSLKRDYGFPLDVYRITSATANLQTGQKTTTKTKYHVARAIILPDLLARKFKFNSDYSKQNGQFTYGGTFDVREKSIIIDYKDLGFGFLPFRVMDDQIVYNHRLYDIKEVNEFEVQVAAILKLVEIEGTLPYEQQFLNVSSSLNLTQRTGLNWNMSLSLGSTTGIGTAQG